MKQRRNYPLGHQEICDNCGIKFSRPPSGCKGKKQHFCNIECLNKYYDTHNKGGYRAFGRGKQEHRVFMEQTIGRPLLKSEFVHHINGNKRDNRLENLIIMTRAEHTKMHMKETRHPKYNIDQAIKMFHYGLNMNQIRKVLSVNSGAIWKAFKRRGII